MRSFPLPGTDTQVSALGLGCMNIGGGWNDESYSAEDIDRADQLINAAVDSGINLFDHADIYMGGKCEAVFGEVLKRNPGLRDRMILQTKCGIRFSDPSRRHHVGRYDFSRGHIVASVEGSLARLNTDRIDILLLHRPDALAEPEEVAGAFDELRGAGKVRLFGVSNHTASRMRLLAHVLSEPLVANQVRLSLVEHQLIEEDISVNEGESLTDSRSGVLDYCREHGVLVQAWGPLAQGRAVKEEGPLRDIVLALAAEKDVPPEAVVLSWLLRHPAGIQPIVGTTSVERLLNCCRADRDLLTREEWYALYIAARDRALP